MTSLHSFAADIFNEVSHALELPWEKYLSELHEFGAEGDDELRVFKDTDVEIAWSSLVCLLTTLLILHHLEEQA